MPVTSIEIKDKQGISRKLQFITEQYETGLYVAVYTCDKDWIPRGTPSQTTDVRTEEVYHRELREKAFETGDLVPQYCTNPEWTPGYIEEKATDPDV